MAPVCTMFYTLCKQFVIIKDRCVHEISNKRENCIMISIGIKMLCSYVIGIEIRTYVYTIISY